MAALGDKRQKNWNPNSGYNRYFIASISEQPREALGDS